MAQTPSSAMVTKRKGPHQNKENKNPTINDKKKRSSATPLNGEKKRRKAQTVKLCPMPNTNDLEALPLPDAIEIISQIDRDADRNLQVLLWEIDCHYVLLAHQFKGVRSIAGVPDDFPGTAPPPIQEEALFEWVLTALTNCPAPIDRGVLMADVMGLGKTVQSVAACMLRNALALAKGQPRKPTLIVSPNDAVLLQWQETLIKANVSPNTIFRFAGKSTVPFPNRHHFFLCNRYDLQTEARRIFTKLQNDKTLYLTSPLFPNAKMSLLKCLTNQYLAQQGQAKNWFQILEQRKDSGGKPRDNKMNISEVVTKSLGKYVGVIETIFETVVIDEAHFLKNLGAYWGMAAGLLGLHCNRMIPMSGTPYNNSCQDVATLMTMIDARLPCALEKWWKQATKSVAAKDVQDAIQEWSQQYLIRRDKDVISANLPAKIIRKKHVGPLPLELSVYEHYEGRFLEILNKFQFLEGRKRNLFQQQKMKEYFELMLAFASCMRCSLIHPSLAESGRDFTILFSPSRKSQAKAQEKPHRCVCCKRNTRREKKKAKKLMELADFEEGEWDDDDDANSLMDFIVGDDVIEWADGSEDENSVTVRNSRKVKGETEKAEKLKLKARKFCGKMEKDEKPKPKALDSHQETEEQRKAHLRRHFARMPPLGQGEMMPIPVSLCPLAEYGIRHFACESCLDIMLMNVQDCPACVAAQARLRLEHGSNELMKKKAEGRGNRSSAADLEAPEDMAVEIPRRLYCQEIFGGFRASAKLESIVEDYSLLPSDDKVLICSFFKGSLDLLEGIFREMNVVTARFDGDFGHGERQFELDRFKEKESCRVLLMTVQTGGTGLNLVNANHVWFVDRFWNPTVMEQCEDRCYRLGQTKEVDVTYHDVSYTTDDVMHHINQAKTDNAKIILADGSKLSTSTSGMSFKDISGQVGEAVRRVRAARLQFVMSSKQHIYKPLPPSPEGILHAAGLRGSERCRFESLVDAIASMLGYTVTPPAPQGVSVPAAGSAGTHGPVPVDVTSGGKSGAPRQPDRNEASIQDDYVNDVKLPAITLQAKREHTAVVTPRDSFCLNEMEELKQAGKPSKSQSAGGALIKRDEAANYQPEQTKSRSLAPIDTSLMGEEEALVNMVTPSPAMACLRGVKPKQDKPKSWLDDDSDDDMILGAIAFNNNAAQKQKQG